MKPRLSLGPVLYYWSKDKLIDFYDDIALSPVDIVYLGETICARRRSMRPEDWLQVAERLTDAGKEVVLSTLALIEAGSELSATRRICEQHDYAVETNDMGALHMRSGNGAFVAGHSVNIYNHHTLDLFASLGMKRWVLPVELSRDTLVDILKHIQQSVETEVFAFGRLPLAYSARCYTARAHDLPKDACEFKCMDYEDGLLLETREDEQFLTLNGIQTQSAHVHSLIADMDDILQLGIDVLRISPQSQHTKTVINYYNQMINGDIEAAKAVEGVASLFPADTCNGYWYGKPGMDQVADNIV